MRPDQNELAHGPHVVFEAKDNLQFDEILLDLANIMTDPVETEAASRRFPSNDDLAHFGRGILMGGADIIPGVSGGTVALILGIYERLVTAISRCDQTLFGHLRAARFRAITEYLDIRFLIPLAMGIGCGVVGLGTVMHELLEHYLQFTLAAFFGLIGASCYLVWRLVKHWNPVELVLILAGAIFAFWLVGQPALSSPPDSLWYIFICGTVAICAMILPGISGAFILLILGKYHDITGIIKDTLKLNLTGEGIAVVAVFGCGCVLGLLTFSKVLKWLLHHHGSMTMATLCGFMAGSLRRIWPFQRDTTPEIEEFKHKVFEHIPLSSIPINATTLATVVVALLAGGFVMALDRFAGGSVEAEHEIEDDE